MEQEKQTRQQHIYAALLKEITDGEKKGNRLPTLKVLTERFGVSRFTIQNVMKRLEDEGYIERFHGRGTFIHDRISPLAMKDMVSICLKFHQHVYGDLCTELINRLQDYHKAVTLVDPSNTDLLKKISFTPSKYFFVDGDNLFDYSILNMRSFQNKTVIGLLQWPNVANNYHRVLIDWVDSAKQRVDHLAELGHRDILYVTSGGHQKPLIKDDFGDSRLDQGICRDFMFLRKWKELGNRCTILETHECNKVQSIDEEQLFTAYKQLKPTAIVGGRDVDVLTCYNALLPHFPQIKDKICMVGFFDTPWSQATEQKMTTVSLNLDQIAENAVNIIKMIESNSSLSTILMKVRPTLVIRETSRHA